MMKAMRALFVAAALLPAGAAGADDLVITNVTVIPMDSERILEGQTVVTRGTSIASIGRTAATDLPADLFEVDGTGKFLIPGLMDLHVHLRSEDELLNYAAWGVTTIMHLGGSGLTGDDVQALKEDVRDGRRLGPDIYTTDRVFDGAPRLNGRSLEITDPATARAEVRRLKARGFDFVKIYNNIDRPEFEAIVDEARRQNLAVIGHIPRKFRALDALSSGHSAIAHTEELFFTHFGGPRSTDEGMDRHYAPDMTRLEPLVRTLLENGVAVMPDLSFTFTNQLMWDGLELVWNDPEFHYLHPSTGSMWEQSNINRRDNLANFMLRSRMKYELMLKLTRRFEDAGVLQVIGTDASLPGLFPGKAAHRELTELIKAGLSNYEALAAGTRNGGEFVRRLIDPNARLGQVRAGYQADLLLLDDNPLDDIRHVRNIAGVVANGRFSERQTLDARRAALRGRYGNLRKISATVDDALSTADAAERLRRLVASMSTHDDTRELDMIEARINAEGYGAAYAGNMERALEILSLNTELFPASANTWDSLAEVTLYLGRAAEALEFYRRALEADPTLESAAEQIRIIEDGGN